MTALIVSTRHPRSIRARSSDCMSRLSSLAKRLRKKKEKKKLSTVHADPEEVIWDFGGDDK